MGFTHPCIWGINASLNIFDYFWLISITKIMGYKKKILNIFLLSLSNEPCNKYKAKGSTHTFITTDLIRSSHSNSLFSSGYMAWRHPEIYGCVWWAVKVYLNTETILRQTTAADCKSIYYFNTTAATDPI